MSDMLDDGLGSFQEEYDEVFTGDERVSNLLKLTSDSFTREKRTIKIKEIGFTDPIKKGRQDTMSGLTSTIRDLGILQPIHVMAVSEESEEDDYKYILLDGLRRVFGAAKNGVEEVDAIVWDFKDKDLGMDLAVYVSLLLNRNQRRDWKENWHYYQILELQSSDITPGTIEYLLQLEAGDAMKLKDVMLCNYDEVKQALLNGEKGLDACYKMLTKLRKEEDRLAMEDATGVDDSIEGAENLTSGEGGLPQLSDDDVKELLDMVDDLDEDMDVDEDDFDSMNRSSFGDEQQKVGERHPLDPALRQAVLARDKFTCKCCGMKLIGARLGLIAVHHVLPVHTGGKDILDNLVTLCVGCHLSLHIMERNGGSIMMSKDDYEELSEGEQASLKKALKLARIAIEADKRKGLSKEDVAKATADAIRHPMPGAGMKDNQTAYAIEGQKQAQEVEEDEDDE